MRKVFVFLYPINFLSLHLPHLGKFISPNPIVLFPVFALLFFRLKPLPLLKFTYLTPTPSLVIMIFIRKTIVIDDVDDAIVLNEDMKSEMCIPIFFQGEPIGVLDFEHRIPKAFTKYDARMAEFFARQLSNSLKIYLDLAPIVDSIVKLNVGSQEIKVKVDTSAKIISEKMKGRIREEFQSSLNSAIQNGEKVGELLGSINNILITIKECEGFIETLSRSLSEFMCIVEMFMRRKDAEKKI